jgi:hypothetical protein
MDRIPAAVAALSVQDLEGLAVPLGRLWEDRPVVLVFLRHFG